MTTDNAAQLAPPVSLVVGQEYRMSDDSIGADGIQMSLIMQYGSGLSLTPLVTLKNGVTLLLLLSSLELPTQHGQMGFEGETVTANGLMEVKGVFSKNGGGWLQLVR